MKNEGKNPLGKECGRGRKIKENGSVKSEEEKPIEREERLPTKGKHVSPNASLQT